MERNMPPGRGFLALALSCYKDAAPTELGRRPLPSAQEIINSMAVGNA